MPHNDVTKKEVKRILWISRHPPLPKQIEELRRIFGNIELIQYAGFVKDDKHVAELIKMYKADDVVCIIPMSMIYHIVRDMKIYPLFPEMELLPNDAKEYDYMDQKTGKKYRHVKFTRIVGFEIKKVPP